jgi:hypothetical protein
MPEVTGADSAWPSAEAIIDHSALSVELTSRLRENIAAKAGETPTQKKPNAQRIAVRANAVMFCLVIYFRMGHPCC